MNILASETQIQIDVEQLRSAFPSTQDLYREVCALLFFRYGITPTANMLYQYVRKGSMSAPAGALRKFWSDLREKSRVRIENADVPETVNYAAGNLVSILWTEAQTAALQTHEASTIEWKEKLRQLESRTIEVDHQLEEMNTELDMSRESLNKVQLELQEAEKQHAVDIEVSAALEKTVKTLQIERDELRQAQEQSRRDLSKDIQTLDEALAKAEERYQSLEARSLMEIDRERQRVVKAEKEISNLRQQQRREHQKHRQEVIKLQAVAVRTSELVGKLRGQLHATVTHNKQLLKENRNLLSRKLA